MSEYQLFFFLRYKQQMIDLFGGDFVLSLCLFDISVGVGAFVTGLSQTSSMLSYNFQWLM